MADDVVADSIEAQFARRLAGNEKKNRDKALKKLKKYVALRTQKTDGGFNRDEMLRIWKGLFYCMWMSDKPLVQEELSKNISDLMLDISNTKAAMLFFDVFLQTMEREWRGIDRLRMDKFYLLVRNMLETAFKFLKMKDWDAGVVDWMLAIMKNGPISPTQPMSGMHYHFCDIYLEELAKVAGDELSQEVVLKFLDPYCIFITKAKNFDLVRSAVDEVFQQLIENSKPALELLAEEEDDEAIVEIRSHTQMAGIYSSPIIALKIDYASLADRLYCLATQEDVLSRNRKKAFALVEKFRELAEDRLPLSGVPDAEYSSEDEVELLEERLTSEIVHEDSKEFEEKQEMRKAKRKRMRRRRAGMLKNDSDDEDDNDSTMNEIIQSEDDADVQKFTVDDSNSLKKSDSKDNKKKKQAKRKKTKSIHNDKLGNEPLHLPLQVIENGSGGKRTSKLTVDSNVKDIEITDDKKADVSENMPDLIQDVAKSDRYTERSKKCHAQGKDKFGNLRKWLDTESSDEHGSVCVNKQRANAQIVEECPSNLASTIVCDDNCSQQCSDDKVLATVKLSKKQLKVRKLKKKNEVSHDSIKQKASSTNDKSLVCESVDDPKLKSVKKKTKKRNTNNLSTGVNNDALHAYASPAEAISKEKIIKADSDESLSTVSLRHRNVKKRKATKLVDKSSGHTGSAFIKFAAEKVSKAAENKRLAAVKRKAVDPVLPHSPKRVVFEMSKTQIKPFRKTDKALACSPTPNSIPFDPKRTPDFGLLKCRQSKGTPKRDRHKASDFF